MLGEHKRWIFSTVSNQPDIGKYIYQYLRTIIYCDISLPNIYMYIYMFNQNSECSGNTLLGIHIISDALDLCSVML